MSNFLFFPLYPLEFFPKTGQNSKKCFTKVWSPLLRMTMTMMMVILYHPMDLNPLLCVAVNCVVISGFFSNHSYRFPLLDKMLHLISVTRVGNFFNFGQLFKAFGNNKFAQISHILRHFL